MNPPNDDRELSRLFEEARRLDEESAPPFHGLLERTRGRPAQASTAGFRGLAVAAVLALLALSVFLLRSVPKPSPHGASPQEPPPMTMEAWKAPTDFLLRTPGGELLSSTPAVPEPVPDYSSLEPVRTKKGAQS